MADGRFPAAEVEVTADLVRRLLADQHADLADRPVAVVANGWDNVIARIGDDLAARVPRRQLAADLVVNEQRWVPQLADRLPIPIAAPLRVGAPTAYYPWAWSVCRWFDGDVAADTPLADPPAEATRLAEFVAALHQPAPVDAPGNPNRGQPVAGLIPRIAANVQRLDDAALATHISARVDVLSRTPAWDGPAVWLHGDLHSANIVVRDGAIAAVLDFGDITSGDPAVDLAVAWMLFDGVALDEFRRAAGPDGEAVDGATWNRAQLWGLHFAVLYLLHIDAAARFERMGRRLLQALLPPR